MSQKELTPDDDFEPMVPDIPEPENYEEKRRERYGQGLSIDEWLARPTENFLILAYRIREANRK